jgi:hypothetical protein
VYRVFKQLKDGDFLHVATRDGLEEAVQLARALKALWPGSYEVRDSDNNDMAPAEIRRNSAEPIEFD